MTTLEADGELFQAEQRDPENEPLFQRPPQNAAFSI